METHSELNTDQTINEEAAEWLIRLDGDSAITQAERQALGEWMARSPEHRNKLNRLAAMWDKLNVLTELAVPLEGAAPAKSAKPQQSWSLSGVGAMAMAATFIVGFVLLFQAGMFAAALDASNGAYTTAIGEQKTLQLADGSTLILNTNSQIKVGFDEQFRDIQLLHGEVHFEVAKNKHVPFRVFAGKGRVQAVGTAFTIYRAAQSVDVTVTEGRVAVASVTTPYSSELPANGKQTTEQPEPLALDIGSLVAGQGASIKPNQNAGDQQPEVVLDDMAIYSQSELQKRLAWHEGLIIFSGEPLEEVVAEISRYTEMQIEIPEAEVRALTVGGQFAVGDTAMMLDVLEATFDLQIEYTSNQRVKILARK